MFSDRFPLDLHHKRGKLQLLPGFPIVTAPRAISRDEAAVAGLTVHLYRPGARWRMRPAFGQVRGIRTRGSFVTMVRIVTRSLMRSKR